MSLCSKDGAVSSAEELGICVPGGQRVTCEPALPLYLHVSQRTLLLTFAERSQQFKKQFVV